MLLVLHQLPLLMLAVRPETAGLHPQAACLHLQRQPLRHLPLLGCWPEGRYWLQHCLQPDWPLPEWQLLPRHWVQGKA